MKDEARAAILLVEDDANLRTALGDNLRDEGHHVAEVSSTVEADAALAAQQFDLLILDVMLPGEDGYTFCRRLRASGFTAPVLMLTARSLEEDAVRGFEVGVQDYVTKPYRLRELLARVRALLQRHDPVPASVYAFGSYVLDLARRQVRDAEGRPVELTRTEFDLLSLLVRRQDQAWTRDALLNEIWGREIVVDPRTVDNFVSSLKKKLGWTRGCGFAIQTVRGVGYRMETTSMTKR